MPGMLESGDTIQSLNAAWVAYLLNEHTGTLAPRLQAIYWNRDLSMPTPSPSNNQACAQTVRKVLLALGLNPEQGGIVVGHTVQVGGIPIFCEGLVWRVDVGLSEAFGRRRAPIEVLRITLHSSPPDRKPTVQIMQGLIGNATYRGSAYTYADGKLRSVSCTQHLFA